MEQFILNVLAAYGLAGVVILALGWTVIQQQRNGSKINESRLSERDLLIKTIENNTASRRESSAIIAARNLVTEELAKAVEKQALVFEVFMQKEDFHNDGIRDKLQEYKLVIDAIAEAMRGTQSILRDLRDKQEKMYQELGGR